jgi:DNA-directed RNA polymerase specialized sigma24 family protein
LSDGKLLAHLVAARESGDREQTLEALQILAFGNLERVRGWVALKVPRSDVDDVASAVLESAIAAAVRAPFGGRAVGEFRAWLHVITRRRIADYHRRKERRIDEAPLPEEHEGDEDIYGLTPTTPDASGAVFVADLLEAALGDLSDVHRSCIQLAGPSEMGFEGRSAKETAARINDQFQTSGNDSMTDVNVHQILARFRRRCRELYEAGEQSG